MKHYRLVKNNFVPWSGWCDRMSKQGCLLTFVGRASRNRITPEGKYLINCLRCGDDVFDAMVLVYDDNERIVYFDDDEVELVWDDGDP